MKKKIFLIGVNLQFVLVVFSSFFFSSKKKEETLDKSLEKTKESVIGKLARAIVGKSQVDADVLDNLEEILVSADVGVETHF